MLTLKYAFLLILIFSSLKVISSTLYSPEESLRYYEELILVLNGSEQLNQTGCTDFNDVSFKSPRRRFKGRSIGLNKCSLSKICQLIEKKQGDKYLYKNSKGETIPKNHIFRAPSKVLNCLARNKTITGALKSLPDLTMDESFKFMKLLTSANTFLLMNREKLQIEGYMKGLLSTMNISTGINLEQSKIDKFIKYFNEQEKSKESIKKEKIKIINNMQDDELFSLLNDPKSLSVYKSLSESQKEKLNTKLNQNNESLIQPFNQVKKQIINYLKLKGKTSEIKGMIKRIESITLKPLSLDEYIEESTCSSPNAFYLGTDHSVTICPQMVNYPKEGLMSLFTHELAHAIDPCVSGYTYSEDSPTRLFNSFPGSTNDKYKNRVDAVTYSSNPFIENIQCLEKTGMSYNTNKEIKDFLDKAVPYINSILMYDLEEKHKDLKDRVKYYEYLLANNQLSQLRHCAIGARNAQGGEVFSDFIATEIGAKRISEYPKNIQREKVIESFSIFLEGSCSQTSHDSDYQKNSLQKELDSKGCFNYSEAFLEQVHNDSSDHNSTHPENAFRIEKIMLRNSVFTNILGCRSGEKDCAL